MLPLTAGSLKGSLLAKQHYRYSSATIPSGKTRSRIKSTVLSGFTPELSIVVENMKNLSHSANLNDPVHDNPVC